MDKDELERLNRLGSNLTRTASSGPLAARRNAEAEYTIYCRQLMREGKLSRLKRKYTGF